MLSIFILAIEILIAIFVHDRIIRPYIGDFLVVILVYCFIKSFFNIPVLTTAIIVLGFSIIVEILQYFEIAGKLGFQKSEFAKIVIGNSFEWIDVIAYTLGIAFVLLIEKLIAGKRSC